MSVRFLVVLRINIGIISCIFLTLEFFQLFILVRSILPVKAIAHGCRASCDHLWSLAKNVISRIVYLHFFFLTVEMVFARAISFKFIVQSLILLLNSLLATCQIPSLRPGDAAPPFAIQTLDGRILYKNQKASSSVPAHPVIFHAYSKHSAFLEALWTDKRSLRSLVEHTPRNTHFVFLSSTDWAQTDALRMRRHLHRAIDQYFNR